MFITSQYYIEVKNLNIGIGNRFYFIFRNIAVSSQKSTGERK